MARGMSIATTAAGSPTPAKGTSMMSTIPFTPTPMGPSVGRVATSFSVPVRIVVPERDGLSSAGPCPTVFPSTKGQAVEFDTPMREPFQNSEDVVEVPARRSKRRRLTSGKEKAVTPPFRPARAAKAPKSRKDKGKGAASRVPVNVPALAEDDEPVTARILWNQRGIPTAGCVRSCKFGLVCSRAGGKVCQRCSRNHAKCFRMLSEQALNIIAFWLSA